MSSPTIWSAGRYESVAAHIEQIATEVIDAADSRTPVHDAAVVDLACGTGSAALAAAARGALVTAVDFTPELVALGEQKAGATNRSIAWVTADASATGLPTHSYDVAVSNMGTIFVEPTAQVAEIERLLKTAGTLAFSAWAPAEDNPFFSPIVDVLGPRPASDYSPDQWGVPDTINARLSEGFHDVDIDKRIYTWQFPSVDIALRFLSHESPLHLSVLDHIADAQRAELLAAFETALCACADDAGVRFDTPYVVVTARRR